MAIYISINMFIEDYGLEGAEAIKQNLNAKWFFDVGFNSLYAAHEPYKEACAKARSFYAQNKKTDFGTIYLAKIEIPDNDSQQKPEGVQHGKS